MFFMRTLFSRIIVPDNQIGEIQAKIRMMIFLAIYQENAYRYIELMGESQAVGTYSYSTLCPKLKIIGMNKTPFIDERGVDTTAHEDS